LSGHICRCTGYTPIVAAVLDCAARRKQQRDDECANAEAEHA
jgi:2-furoyl-CoA dehydrogenase 2Fe-2S iron sulfur subunit